MARNIIKDIEEENRRKKQLIQAAFDLFSENGIDNVKLIDIAIKADVGIATLYKYYQNKLNLVIAVSASVWKDALEQYLIIHSIEELYTYNALELIEIYLDRMIYIYKEHPEILKFSAYYKSYVNREKASKEDLVLHTQVLDVLGELFHKKYVEALDNGSIRTDIEESEMYAMFTITMLSMAERFALGLVWADTNKDNHVKELENIKEMILQWCSKKGEIL